MPTGHLLGGPINRSGRSTGTGDIVIIMADVNRDVKGTTTQKQLRHMGLIEAITFLHKETPPNTHQC